MYTSCCETSTHYIRDYYITVQYYCGKAISGENTRYTILLTISKVEFELILLANLCLTLENTIMTASDTKLKAKLVQLQLTIDRTDDVLKSEQPDAIERHLKTLKTIVDEADQYGREEEMAKIVAKEELAQIGEWNVGIEDCGTDEIRMVHDVTWSRI